MKVLIVYDSRSGNTEKMAHAVSEGVSDEGLDVEVKMVDEASVDELPGVDGLILGSPVHYGLPIPKMEEFIDNSVKYQGKILPHRTNTTFHIFSFIKSPFLVLDLLRYHRGARADWAKCINSWVT